MNEDKYISGLPAASSLASDTLWIVDQAGVTKKATGTQMTSFLAGGSFDLDVLPVASTVADANLFVVSQAGTEKSATGTLLKTYFQPNTSGLAAAVSLGDTDKFVIDQAGTPKTTTGTLAKTYFQPHTSGLSPASSIALSDIWVISQSGTPKTATGTQMAALFAAGFDVDGLPVASTLGDTDLYVVSQAGTEKSATGTLLKTYLQPYNSTLAAMAGIAQAGICCFTGAGSVFSRVLGGGTNQIAITNGDGFASNPSVSLASACDMPTATSGSYSVFIRSGAWDVAGWTGTHLAIGGIKASQWGAVRVCSGGNEAYRLDGANTPNILIGTSGPAGSSMSGGIVHKAGTAPTGDVTTCYQQYAATVGGTTAPHFRLANSNVVKLYRANTYTVTNSVPDRSYDASTVAVAELAQVVAALIADLQTIGLLG